MSSFDAAPLEIRKARAGDLEEVAVIQAGTPEASQWNPSDYLTHDFHVAVNGGAIAGFAVARRTAPDEMELLNLAVAPRFRRRGIGRRLVQSFGIAAPHSASEGGSGNPPQTRMHGSVFLEVRESNVPARKFYKALGFQEVSVRQNYYDEPAESAIVMKFHSC